MFYRHSLQQDMRLCLKLFGDPIRQVVKKGKGTVDSTPFGKRRVQHSERIDVNM